MATAGLTGAALARGQDLRALAQAIDLTQPWFAPWAPWLAPLRAELLQGASVTLALNRALDTMSAGHVAHGLRFVPQTELPVGESYEAFISRTGCVPTRDNLHDLLNGVCWLRFAAIKRRLNALQSAEIGRLGVGATRGPLRDALTLFDENAALLSGPEPLRQALSDRDWQTLFVQHRPLWSQARLTLFGHALLEKMLQPYDSITAHVWWVGTDADPGASLDASVAKALSAESLSARTHLPLPVMGIPGWSAANHDPAFYLNTQVFRPKRPPSSH